MHQVQLDDHLYEVAKRRALEAGFSTVDEYLADVLAQDADEIGDNLDHLFTPEVIAELETVSARIGAGEKTYTMDEVQDHFAKKRKQWLRDHAG